MMNGMRFLLVIFTILIFAVTISAALEYGINWPAVFFSDLLQLNWRSQFNTDFLIYLFLFAWWIAWREGVSGKSVALGIFSIFMGGMFGFPYLLYAVYKANGDPKKMLLGVHA